MKFIAFCIDGGITTKLNIAYLSGLAKQYNNKVIKEFFNFILYMHQIKTDFENVFIASKIN